MVGKDVANGRFSLETRCRAPFEGSYTKAKVNLWTSCGLPANATRLMAELSRLYLLDSETTQTAVVVGTMKAI